MLMLFPALLMVSLPLANNDGLRLEKWSCMAAGVNNEGHNRSVAGPSRPNKAAARVAAIRECRNEGLMSCGASFCTQESVPAKF